MKLPSSGEIRNEFKNINEDFITESRETIGNILSGNDSRLLIIVGPCSIYNLDASMEYAQRLHALAKDVDDVMFIVMRTYIEKSRTSVGWPGFVLEPRGPGRGDVSTGLRKSREFFCQLQALGVPLACEMVNPLILPYIEDLVSWFSVGARNVGSYLHRVAASNLSVPVGFKNPLCGNIDIALDALRVAQQQNPYIYLDEAGVCESLSSGAPWAHVVLRGSHQGVNYHRETIENVRSRLEGLNLNPSVIVDCSHMNARNKARLQSKVLETVINDSRDLIAGVMMESFLVEGRQGFDSSRYGQSVTDDCMGWDETVELIRQTANKLRGLS